MQLHLILLEWFQQPTSLGEDVESYFSSYVRVIDIVCVFFILWGAYKGWQKGFLIELISILVFLLGIVVIFLGVTYLFVSADKAIGTTPKIIKFTVFVLLYLVGSLGLNKMSRILQDKIDYSVLDTFDNFAAMILGGFKYAVYLCIFFGLLQAAGLGFSPEVTRDAKVYQSLLKLQLWLVEIGATLAPSIGDMHRDVRKLLK